MEATRWPESWQWFVREAVTPGTTQHTRGLLQSLFTSPPLSPRQIPRDAPGLENLNL